MHPSRILATTDYRPWLLPAGPWLMAQTWHDLLFAHWPLPPASLAAHIPAGLHLDTFAGQAYLGIVPFRMSGVRRRGLPAVPGFAAFPELNVRTYVSDGSKPGVWFFSLDAGNLAAVTGARAFFHLPYFYARMLQAGPDYISQRTHPGAPAAELLARYWPIGEPCRAQPDTLEHWLTERYCLYACDRHGRLYRGNIHHLPWPLQPAVADIVRNTMARPLGLELPATAPLLHFARRLDVLVWPLEQVAPAPTTTA